MPIVPTPTALGQRDWFNPGGLPNPALPPGYVCDGGAIWRVATTASGSERKYSVSPLPVAITGIATHADTQAQSVVIAWRDRSGLLTATLPREEAFSGSKVRILAKFGLPVDVSRSGELSRYLLAFEMENAAELPRSVITNRMGWHGDDFVLGNHSFGEGTYVARPPAGFADACDGLVMGGTLTGWREGVLRNLQPYPLAFVGIYASVASVLLRYLPAAEGFTLEWSGTTSGGKTTALHSGASVWGDPLRVTRTWDATRVGGQGLLAASGSLPLFMDDTAQIDDPEIALKMTYDVTKGVGRTRGDAFGSLQATTAWRTLMLSTGEASIARKAGLTGAAARSILLTGSPFGDSSPSVARDVERIRSAYVEHHGMLGPVIVRALQVGKATVDPVHWASYREAWAARAPGHKLASRLGGHMALLQVAGDVIEQTRLGLGLDPAKMLEPVWENAIKSV